MDAIEISSKISYPYIEKYNVGGSWTKELLTLCVFKRPWEKMAIMQMENLGGMAGI